MSRKRAGAIVLALGLIVAACGGAAPPAGSSPVAGEPASSTSAPQTVPATAPTASPAPVDVAPLFSAQLDSLRSGVMTIEGVATIGPVEVLLSGTMTSQGADSRMSMTATFAGVESTSEQVEVAGRRYVKTGDGPWLEAGPASSEDLSDALRKAEGLSFRDDGTEIRDDQTVHRLVAAGGSTFDPATLLSSTSGASNVKGSFVFFALEDGTPVGAQVDATWTQTEGDASVAAGLSFELRFSQLGVRQVVRIPSPVWVQFTSQRWDYSIAYPSDFDYDKDKDFDYFIGPSGSSMLSGRENNRGFTLNVIAKAQLDSFKRELRAKSTKNEAITVAGLNGRLLTISGQSKDFGGKVTVYEVVLVKGKHVFYILWFGPTSSARDDLATFKQALSTFALT